jgi:hypothetical protein
MLERHIMTRRNGRRVQGKGGGMQDENEAPAGLVGRYFHVMIGDGNRVLYQGRVVAQIDQTHYLCQLYEWLLGEPSTLHVFCVEDMAVKPADMRSEGAFQFYDDVEDMRNWFDIHRHDYASETEGEPA